MPSQFETVLKAALELSEMQRVLLIDELVESLPPTTEPYSDEEMLAELERRQAEYEKDPSIAIPWEQVKRTSGEEMFEELKRRAAEVEEGLVKPIPLGEVWREEDE